MANKTNTPVFHPHVCLALRFGIQINVPLINVEAVFPLLIFPQLHFSTNPRFNPVLHMAKGAQVGPSFLEIWFEI